MKKLVLCKHCGLIMTSKGLCRSCYDVERYKNSKEIKKESPEWRAEGRRCSRCDRMLNEYECQDCGKQHGLEYKNSGVCVACMFEYF